MFGLVVIMKTTIVVLWLMIVAGLLANCSLNSADPGESLDRRRLAAHEQPAPLPEQTPEMASAIFAGGCFWCMERPFDELEGVLATTSGYIGGHVENPTYYQVARDDTGHAEAVRVLYDPQKVSFKQLLDVYWRNVDPFDPRGQFCDKGDPYRSAIFYQDDEQRRLSEASKHEVEKRFNRAVHTEVVAASVFYPAEIYHQDYYRKKPYRYTYYRFACQRDLRLEHLWGS